MSFSNTYLNSSYLTSNYSGLIGSLGSFSGVGGFSASAPAPEVAVVAVPSIANAVNEVMEAVDKAGVSGQQKQAIVSAIDSAFAKLDKEGDHIDSNDPLYQQVMQRIAKAAGS